MSGRAGAPPFDYNGVIGTGQSLATGALPILSTTERHGNLKLSLGSARVPPWDPEQRGLELVPLTEPIRPLATRYPSPYPDNCYGETLHAAMAREISTLVRRADARNDHITVHTVVGECGQGMAALKRHDGDTSGITGRSYAAAVFELAAIARLARLSGRTFGLRAVVVTHGETDWDSPTYEAELVELLATLNRDAARHTGQSEPAVMFLSQTFAFPTGAGQRPPATQTQWRLGVTQAAQFVCTGPRYQYEGSGDGVHLVVESYQALGEKTGQVYFERLIARKDWRPLSPLAVTARGRVVSVRFHVPVAPLVWDETLPPPDAWPQGRGFELFAGTAHIGIAGVELDGDTVHVTARSDLPADLTLGYAMTSSGAPMPVRSHSYRWGLLRDSDPFVGSTTNLAQPNHCVSFELPVTRAD
jgi:hypothetical protein